MKALYAGSVVVQGQNAAILQALIAPPKCFRDEYQYWENECAKCDRCAFKIPCIGGMPLSHPHVTELNPVYNCTRSI